MFYQMGTVETEFADIIWEREPVSSASLVTAAEEKFGWKKSTTYTVLRRLCDKGLFANNSGVVSSLVSKEEFFSVQSENFVEDTFSGSLPAFIAAFSRRKKLSSDEIEEIRRMIDNMGEK